MWIADVHRFVKIRLRQLVDAVDEVRAVAERPRLRAIAKNGNRLTRERLSDKCGYDAPIAEPHARAVGIKDADDFRIDAVGAVVGHRHRFRETLRFIVAAARADRIHVAPVGLFLRVL